MATKADSHAIVRELVSRGFDALANKVPAAAEGERPGAVQRIAAFWQELSADEREQVTSYVAGAATSVAAALPMVAAGTIRRARQRVKKAAARKVGKVEKAADELAARKSKKEKKKQEKEAKKEAEKKAKKEKRAEKEKKRESKKKHRKESA